MCFSSHLKLFVIPQMHMLFFLNLGMLSLSQPLSTCVHAHTQNTCTHHPAHCRLYFRTRMDVFPVRGSWTHSSSVHHPLAALFFCTRALWASRSLCSDGFGVRALSLKSSCLATNCSSITGLCDPGQVNISMPQFPNL